VISRHAAEGRPWRRWHAAGRRWRHSIRWRLVTLFLLLALASTAVFVIGTQQVVRGGWQGYAKPMLADYLDRLASEIGSPPDEAKARAMTRRLPLSIRIEGPAVRFDSHPGHEWREHADPFDPGRGAAGWGLVRVTADGHRIIFGPGEPADGRRPRFFGWISLAVLLSMTGVAYGVVHRLLRPLGDIGRGAQAYGAGQFGQPIRVRRDDELGDLARRINEMAGNLHGMLEAKRTLLLAISHELRSPLTRARLNAELIDDSPARQALLRDLGEMRDLIADLLESERLAAGHAALQRERLDLGPWLHEQLAAIAGEPPVMLDLAPDLGSLQADPARLKLLLRNLVHNARQHGAAPDGQAPVLRAWREADARGSRLLLSLRDFGPGVGADQLNQLAEPFYRTDAARLRSTGGVGLGLHLCRQVAVAHGGGLEFGRAEPGLCVTVSLPG
jgi:signal transduction histidine kinase